MLSNERARGIFYQLLLLAAVIAHEMGHCQLRHISRMYADGKRLSAATIAGVLAGALMSAANPQVGTAVLPVDFKTIPGQIAEIMRLVRPQLVLCTGVDMGADLIIVVFAVVVIGGMGSIMGAIVTGFGLGLIEGLTKVFYPEASTTVIFIIMTIVLLIRPAGLFGTQK